MAQPPCRFLLGLGALGGLGAAVCIRVALGPPCLGLLRLACLGLAHLRVVVVRSVVGDVRLEEDLLVALEAVAIVGAGRHRLESLPRLVLVLAGARLVQVLDGEVDVGVRV